MEKLRAIFVVLIGLLIGCSSPAVPVPVSTIESGANISGQPRPEPTRGTCQTETIPLPDISGFDPVNGTGALAYSGDGLKLFFPETGNLVTIHTDAKPKLALGDTALVWSPDAQQIAFFYAVLGLPQECRLGYLMLADLSQGEVRPLTQVAGVYSHPAWSPDGARLAFTDRNGGLHVLRVSDGTLSTLSQNVLGAIAPIWLDDNHVVYLRHQSGAGQDLKAELVSHPLDGSAPSVLLADAPIRDHSFVVSPDGKRLVYLRGALYLVDLQNGTERNLGFETSLEELLQWSPNGLYILGRGGQSGIFLIHPDASQAIKQLDFFGRPGVKQAWAPDGNRFAVLIGTEGKSTRIGVYTVADENLRELPVEVDRPFELAWSTR